MKIVRKDAYNKIAPVIVAQVPDKDYAEMIVKLLNENRSSHNKKFYYQAVSDQYMVEEEQ